MKDIHKETAARLFDIPEQDVTPAQRRIAKTLRFGVSYGAIDLVTIHGEREIQDAVPEVYTVDFSNLEARMAALKVDKHNG